MMTSLPQRAPRALRLTRLLLPIALTVLSASLVSALPPRSKLLTQTSTIKLDAEVPWVAGWDLEGQAIGLGALMSRGKSGFVFTLTKPDCLRCEDGLRYLLSAQDRLAKRGVQLVIIFTGEHHPDDLKSWLKSRGVWGASSDERWQHQKPIFLIDRYGVIDERMGTEGQLPRSFVVGRQGRVLKMIGQEGYDLIDLIISSVSGQAEN